MVKTAKLSDSIPPLKDQGVDHVVNSPILGQSIQSKLITIPATATYSVVLADHGLANMADADYCVLIGGEFAGVVKVDESTKTVLGFDVLNGAQNEVLNLVIVGRVANQMKADGTF